jgi:hypothetical protein
MCIYTYIYVYIHRYLCDRHVNTAFIFPTAMDFILFYRSQFLSFFIVHNLHYVPLLFLDDQVDSAFIFPTAVDFILFSSFLIF